jgi:hypothetical protein
MKSVLLVLFCAVLPFFVLAQTGPGGVGNTLGSGQPRNVLWLDASKLPLTDGNDITTWSDLSGNANNLTTTAAISPQFENTTPLNGLGYARFSKADNRILITAFNDMPQSAYTVVVVYRTSATGQGLISYAASDASPDEYAIRNSDALRTYIGSGAFDQSTIATNNNNFRVLVNSWDNIDGILDYYIDGNETGTLYRTVNGFKIGLNLQSGGTLAIGNDQDLLNGGYETADAFTGDIAEVILYDRKLNAMQVRILNNYINSKYGIAIPGGNDFYAGDTPANGNHDFDLIGVGRLNGTVHNESNSSGFILSGITYTSASTFAFAGHNNAANSAVTTNLGAGVAQRWNRNWYIQFTNTLTVDATFDLSEGINGGTPVNVNNYVLLKWNTGTSLWEASVTPISKTINGDRISFRVSNAAGNGRYTLGTLDATASPVTGINVRTWYSYQTGQWNNPNVWTLDGGVVPLLTNPGNEIPQPSDNVVITNGRTVTMNISNVTLAGIRVDGTLNVAASSGHNFNNIEGNGRIRIAGAAGIDNFPAGVTTSFADPINGGTVEYYGGNNIALTQNRTLNNVEVKLTGASTSCFLLANYVLNGTLQIESGTFQFNDGVSTVNRTLAITGNVTIESGASIKTGSAGGVHQFDLYGDLNNNSGTLELTNYTTADYSTAAPATGAVNANFISGLQNQELICNGFSKFWRIKIDKGLDDTYKLRITANSIANFNLLGYAAHSNDGDLTPLGAQTTNNNALGLIRGTVEIGTNVVISTLNNTGNYCVYSPATLWVNGGSVTKPAGTAIVSYGKIRVSNGTLNAPINSGITLRVNGTVEVEGGTVTVNQIRTSVLGANNIGGYIQTGGSVTVNPGSAGISEDYYTFSMTYPGNVFRMGGGTLTIRKAATSTDRGLIYINSDPQNVTVTGGTVILELSTGNANYAITSRAAFWNLTLRKTVSNTQTFKLRGGTSGDSPATITTLPAQPLVVLNSLNIVNPTAGSNPTVLDALGNDVILGKDFFIESNAVYTTGTNTTRFTGAANAILNLGGVARAFNHTYIEKTNPTTALSIQNGFAAPAVALTVNGTFSAVQGNITYGTHIISAKSDVAISTTVGASSTGKVVLDGTLTQTIASNNGIFHFVELNNATGFNLTTGTLNINETLTMTNGIFNIGINKLVLQGATANIAGTGFGLTKMIQTAGNSSDGGLELYYGTGSNILKTFPIGTNANSTVRYTPANIQKISSASAGYIQVNPTDEILQTTNISTGGPDILSYYWRIRHRGFSVLPTVAYNFNYADTDVDATNESNYVPGRVLDATPFTRATDGGTDDINTTTNIIYFNGVSTAASFPGTGFTLTAASYTAGGSARFTGAPTVYYSRNSSNTSPTGFPGVSWHNGNSWSLTSHTGAAAGNFPQAGDIAIIGSGSTSGNNYHAIHVTSANASAAQVTFAPVPAGTFSPRITVDPTRSANFVRVSGPGTVMIRATDTQVPTIVGDFGDFANETTSVYNYSSVSGALINLPTNPVVFPNLRFEGGTGTFSRRMTIPANIIVRRNMTIDQLANFVLGGNATVDGNLILSNVGGVAGRLEFPAAGLGYTISVEGDVLMNTTSTGTNSIAVINSPAAGITHNMTVAGNITMANGSIDLFNGNTATDNNTLLQFTGATSTTFTNVGAGSVELYRINMNKGTNTASTMTISAGFTLNGPTDGAVKSLVLNNGLLILNNPTVNFSLTSGNGDFTIPASAGLELRQGQVNVSGANTGILLDGLLRISGGVVNMDDAVNGGNNFIEYSASGNALLNISAGGLTVGSQIRRGLTSTAGILKYQQTGGSVIVGKNAAPQTTRGVFEVLNTGSEFRYQGGSLTLVQGVNSTFVPSFLIDVVAANYSFPATQVLSIGNSSTPTGNTAKNIGIKTNQAFGGITIDNSSANDPVVKLYSLPLTLNGIFSIGNGASFNAQGFELTLRANFINDGAYVASGNKLTLNPSANSNVSGTGTFDIYKLDKISGLQVNISTNLIINNELRILSGNISLGSNFLLARNNVVLDSRVIATSGVGLVMEGNSAQTLSRTNNSTTSRIDILTIRNTSGVVIPDGQGYRFQIERQLRLERGVFDVGGNLILFTANALITPVNPYSVTNMIRTNSSFSDSGVRKTFPASYTSDFVFPVGQAKYTPVTFNFGSPGKTTGSGTPTITLRTAEEPHPAIVEDPEAPDPEIVDVNNVLQYYYTIDADNVDPSFNADAILQYDADYVAVTSPYTEMDYITAAILLDNNPTEAINKSSGVVNTLNKTLTFSFSGITDTQISGDYFAGIDTAIPDNVPVYETITSGDITDPTIFSPQPVGVPNGAIVIINSGHELDFDINSVRLYKTVISANSVLDVDQTFGHRLGIVSGTGTLKITSNTESAVIPAGFFENFFGCSGGALEFAGAGSYDILGGITQVRNLTLTGSGQRLLANNDLLVCQDLLISGPDMFNTNNRAIRIDNDLNLAAGSLNKSNGSRTLTIGRDFNVTGGTFVSVSGGNRIVGRHVNITSGTFNTGSGGILQIGGDLIRSGGTFNGGSGTVRILMNGTSAQHLNGNFTGTAQISRLEVDNTNGLWLLGNASINDQLFLTNGLINPNSNQFKLNTTATVTPVNGSATSYVNGRMYKDLSVGSSFTFPIGKDNRWRYTRVNNVSTGGLTWYAEYFIGNADVLEPLVDNQLSSDPSILHVSGGEYWKVSDNTGPLDVNAQIGLSWGIESDVAPNTSDRESLKVMVWNDGISRWENFGGANFSSGHTQTRGDFTTSTNISFSEQIITLGTTNLANPLPITLDPNGLQAKFTEFNTVELKWRTYTETNNDRFEVERSQNGRDFEYQGEVRGAGTSTTVKNYLIIDEKPLYGKSYYRLKQVDFDGKFTYSNVVGVENTTTPTVEKFYAYPNPVSLSRNTTVNFNRAVNVVVYNNMNRPMRKYENVESFNAAGLAAGMYIIRTSEGQIFKLLIKD